MSLSRGQRLAAWRRHRGKTQIQVAEHVGVGRSAIANWELDKAHPSANHLDAAIEFLAGDHATFYGDIPDPVVAADEGAA